MQNQLFKAFAFYFRIINQVLSAPSFHSWLFGCKTIGKKILQNTLHRTCWEPNISMMSLCCNLGRNLICFKQILQHQSLHLCLGYSGLFSFIYAWSTQLPAITSSSPNSVQLFPDDSPLQITVSPTSESTELTVHIT